MGVGYAQGAAESYLIVEPDRNRRRHRQLVRQSRLLLSPRGSWICTGWISVIVIAVTFIAATVYLVRSAIGRWWGYSILLAIVALLFKPLYEVVSGDVSRVLPGLFGSDGPDGKDQIILASIVSTIFLPPIVAAILMTLIKVATPLLSRK